MLHVRSYGSSGPLLVVLHGGPGVSGYMAPVARRLAKEFRVLEPMQRGSGGERLSVARHVADLHELVAAHDDARPALIGSSWGAMLALAYAAAHPRQAGPLVLIGCGTFDPAARNQMRATIAERIEPPLQQRLDGLPREVADPDQRLELMGQLILPLYSYDLLTSDMEIERVDARAHLETWRDMLRLQDEGLYPAAFAAIESPVLMLHGAVDPHPGPMIQASLEPYLARLEFHQWQQCGHYPWLEKQISDEFFAVVSQWLQSAIDQT